MRRETGCDGEEAENSPEVESPWCREHHLSRMLHCAADRKPGVAQGLGRDEKSLVHDRLVREERAGESETEIPKPPNLGSFADEPADMTSRALPWQTSS